MVFSSNPRQTVRINIVDDNAVEETEMFRVRLSSSDPGVQISGQDFATVTITDVDSMFFFSVFEYQIEEWGGG